VNTRLLTDAQQTFRSAPDSRPPVAYMGVSGMTAGQWFYMDQELSKSLSNRPQQCYEALVLSVSALQLPLSVAEQVEFLNDAIDACEQIIALIDPAKLPHRKFSLL
jgi:hypothetical protein